MARCLIIGMPNVGKTCFTLNFAEYLGLKKIKMIIKQPAGFIATQTYELNQAREEFISAEPNKTRSLHSINLDLPLKKGKGQLTLLDSCGLADGIHPDRDIRRAMAQTIKKVKESEIILHLIDLRRVIDTDGQKIALIDKMIVDYVEKEQAYAVLANKVDLKGTEEGIELLKKELDKVLILPISALYQKGFKEVKSFVWRNL